MTHYWKLMIIELCQVISVQCACCVDCICRRWDPQLKGHIATLQQCLEKECDAYFVKIQKDAIKVCWRWSTSIFCKRVFSHWDCVLFLLSIVKPLSTKIFCSGDLVTLDDNLWSSLNFHCTQYFTTLHCRKIVCHCWWIHFLGGKPEWAQR